MTETWLPIRYRDFYDVPRAVVVGFRGRTYLFDCLFDHEIDDYEAEYTVYELQDDLADDLDRISWTDLGHRAKEVGTVEVSRVVFDSTKRAAVSAGIFEVLGLA